MIEEQQTAIENLEKQNADLKTQENYLNKQLIDLENRRYEKNTTPMAPEMTKAQALRKKAGTLTGLLQTDKSHYNFGNDENSNQFSSTKLTAKSDAKSDATT